jgi:alpha-L-rhamnosidase
MKSTNVRSFWLVTIAFLASLLLALGTLSPVAALEPVGLRCEYRDNPCGIDVVQPRLSWTLVAAPAARAQSQAAYRVLVASEPDKLARQEGDLWDSGKVNSDQQLHIAYAGKRLSSRRQCYWQVRAWDQNGVPSNWSAPAKWSMGLLRPNDWRAKWIYDSAIPNGEGGALPATMARKSFRLDRPIRRATAYASGLGVYELRLNGQRVGEDLLTPEWTSYRKRVHYQVYDVTPLLRSGENAAAALLGEGWFAGRLMAVGRFAYGKQPRFLLQIEVDFADGQTQTIVTDNTWRCTTDGPIRSAGIYDGEVYDARKELAGWDKPGFDAQEWRPATSSAFDDRRLVWQHNEPIRVEKELVPIQRTVPKPGVYVFDLGQNMVGWCRVKAAGSAGKTVTLRHAEMLNGDGTVYTANLRGAPQIDQYTPRVDGEFVFEPHFTYHGFRYVELTGLAKPPPPDAFLGRVFHSSPRLTGRFQCSDPSLNQLMQNILWTQRANLMSSPNDCPQRDERFGWMGDIQSFAQTAIYNMDLAAFFTKFSQDVRDDQADDGRYPDFAPHPGDPNKGFSGVPAWGDAGVIVPWRVYQNYADRRLLEDHFESARRWVDFIHKANPNLLWANGRNNDYNDWLNGDWVKQAGWPAHGGAVPNVVFATAFFTHSTELVAKMADVLGRKEDARRYGELFLRIKAAFNERFVKPDGRIEGDTQGGYALALSFNLLPENLRPKAAQLLVENIGRYHNHLSTGIQTTHRAMLELTRNGYTEVAGQLLTNRTFPSWLYMIDNGATTIWERWDGYVKGRGFQDPGMNSFNHWAFGAVGEWMWRNIAGLNPDDARPGWKHFVIAPRPIGGVTWARGEYNSIRGPVRCDWCSGGGRMNMKVAVPPNTTATVRVPSIDPTAVTESGKPASQTDGVTLLPAEKEAAIFEVGSGEYVFEGKWNAR